MPSPWGNQGYTRKNQGENNPGESYPRSLALLYPLIHIAASKPGPLDTPGTLLRAANQAMPPKPAPIATSGRRSPPSTATSPEHISSLLLAERY